VIDIVAIFSFQILKQIVQENILLRFVGLGSSFFGFERCPLQSLFDYTTKVRIIFEYAKQNQENVEFFLIFFVFSENCITFAFAKITKRLVRFRRASVNCSDITSHGLFLCPDYIPAQRLSYLQLSFALRSGA